MTDTLEIPGLLLSDAMTAADIYAWERAIEAEIGPLAHVNISISSHASKAVWASIYASGPNNSDHWGEFHTTWPEAIRAAHALALTIGPVQRNATIRRMAVAVISFTDEHGTCTEAALIRRGFTASQVANLHEAACERAEVMCRDGRFVVVRAGLDAGDAP